MRATVVKATGWMAAGIVATLGAATPAAAQFGQLGKVLERANDVRQELTFSEAEERQLGSDISTRLRERYGVVQDRAVHRYVTLVGSVLARESARPALDWTFIVLDTGGVNAFAAPGGFIHITRGALGLIQNEAELADVLGHEIAHVTAKHTLNAIRKSKGIETVAQASRREFLSEVTERAYAAVLENSFDRDDEIDADRIGVTLANRTGYAPTGLAAFLTRLADRNKDLTERSGMFASHPQAKARLDSLAKTISSGKLTAAALVASRYTQAITFTAAAVTGIPQAAAPSSSSSSSSPASRDGSGRFGLSGLQAIGREGSSDETVSSAGSRGVNPDRDAAGGPNKALVRVSVSAADIAEFRRGIAG